MRPLATFLLGLTLATLVACKRKPPPDTSPTPSAATPDQLAPGELAEGSESAFGLLLPRVMTVQARQTDTVHAWTAIATPEQVSNYVRARVQEGEVFVGTTSTRYVGVKLRSDKAKLVSVEVRPGVPGSGSRATMVVIDNTPKPLEPDIDKRLKGAGITADGKIRDRKKLQ